MKLQRVDLLWFFLLAATGLAWTLAETRPDTGLTVMVLALALLKGRVVALDFMGLRGVRRPWRWAVCGWLALVLSIIAITFLQAPAA